MGEPLDVKPKENCRWDCVSLGEVMLRLDPGDARVHTAREFRVWEGGGEYNVARGLKRCFGLETAVVTAFADNPVGRLVQDLIYQGGVDQSHVLWRKYDGVGREVRNGLNFTERGYGVRAALGCSDRGHTAVSQLRPGDIDWDAIIGGKARAQEVNRELARFVDVMIGNEEDFTACLGLEVEGLDEHHSKLDVGNFRRMIERAVSEFPNFKAVATTLRNAKTATVNDWGAVCHTGGELYQAQTREGLEIYDRVGGGDSFASGLIYGFLTDKGPQWAVECGAAHGALAMTTPGDTTMATLSEVERVMKGGTARVAR